MGGIIGLSAMKKNPTLGAAGLVMVSAIYLRGFGDIVNNLMSIHLSQCVKLIVRRRAYDENAKTSGDVVFANK